MLGAARIALQGETPHAHERAAIDVVIEALPNTDPYRLWGLCELLDPGTSRLFEIDLLVLGYTQLFLVEIKSGPGEYTGDHQDWYRTAPGDPRPRYLENPYRLANHKAKILASRLRTRMHDPSRTPFVQPLVFLSDPGVRTRFQPLGDLGVVTRATLLKALTHDVFPGAVDKNRPRINAPVARDVEQAMRALGLTPRKSKLIVGAWTLGTVLADGPGYQDRHAVHRDNPRLTRRARVYAVPQASSVQRRQQLRRAADRDAELVFAAGEHPQILRGYDYATDAELGPTLLLDRFDGAMPLDAFLRRESPDFYERVAILEQLARALKHCHKKAVMHGALSPEAVLVRRQPDATLTHGGAPEVRLYNFQLGRGPEVEQTLHWSQLGAAPWAIYQAPELREDPSQRTAAADVWSLGALAFLVFTGRPPGASTVEVDRLLATQRCLDPRAVVDDLPDAVGELVADATRVSPADRIDDPEDWIELLLQEVTRPPAPAPSPVAPSARTELSPLEAGPDDTLGDDLIVRAPDDKRPILGQGATSRVLLVERVSDARAYALKVSLAPEHDERLAEEANELAALRHPRVVQLVDRLTFAGRPCLLLTLAGSETLQRYLSREGTTPLELAARYGEDLLAALEYLEERRVLHRDIKPANLGVGSLQKQAAHLTLFDFSLAGASPGHIEVGTAAYRDPFLRLRGAWDHAAERWSAAVTLHEMVTGVRPTLDRTALDPHARIVLAAERFDASVRATLVAFFTKAFERDVEHRFAQASEMRKAWLFALEPAPVRASEPEPGAPPPLDIGPETPIEALPLSARAKNALDRAGLLVAGDLARLSDNHISAIRGVGSLVAKEILEVRARLGAVAVVAPSTPTTPSVQAPAESVEGWVQALLPPKKKPFAHARELFGLDPIADHLPPLGLSVSALAERLGLTTAAIYIALGKAREIWAKHEHLPALRDEVHALVDEGGGVMELVAGARALGARLPGPAPEDVRPAAALLRLVLEVDKDLDDGLRPLRAPEEGQTLWLVASPAHGRAVKALGAAADELARRALVPSPAEALRALADAAAQTPLETLPAERLAEIAALASAAAARSARLEIYPRGMPAERALALSAAQLRSAIEPSEIIRRVSLRYPDAAELPPRPALDALLAPHGLVFDAASGRYVRPGEGQHTVLSSRVSLIDRAMTALPSERLSMEPDAVLARQFDERLRNAFERREAKVLGVRAHRAVDAARALSVRLGVPWVALDQRLVHAIRVEMDKGGMRKEDLVHAADREGRTGPAWAHLMRLVERAATALGEALIPNREPLLLVQPGLIGRYRLDALVQRLMAGPREHAVFLLTPARDTGPGTIPAIQTTHAGGSDYPLPGVLASQVLWVPHEWLANQHHRAA